MRTSGIRFHKLKRQQLHSRNFFLTSEFQKIRETELSVSEGEREYQADMINMGLLHPSLMAISEKSTSCAVTARKSSSSV